jgi:hypothetical protein
MSFNLEKILKSKRAFRRDLAARPIAEKLLMLDALRERELAIRGHASGAREEPISKKLKHVIEKAKPCPTPSQSK